MYRKTVVIMLLVSMLLIVPGFTSAANNVDNVEFVIGVSKYYVNGQIPGVNMDVSPFIRNDRTFVPVRFLSNALGVTDGNIQWDGASRQVNLTQEGAAIALVIGQASITVNGQTKAMDVAPLIENDRTFLPARYVAEALGYTVEWDDGNKIVICYKGTEMPDISAVIADVSGSANPPEQGQEGKYWMPSDMHGVGAGSPYTGDGYPIFIMAVDTFKPLAEQYLVVHDILIRNGFADEVTAAEILDVVKTKTGWDPGVDKDFTYKSYLIEVRTPGLRSTASINIRE